MQRSFHAQTVNFAGEVIILGGKSIKDGKWTKIHPLNELLIVHVNEDFTIDERVIVIQCDVPEISLLTNYSFCADLHRPKQT